MSTTTIRHTVAEYFEHELASECRHEYIDREIISLSPSTADYDCGAKFQHYQLMPVFREYL